MRIIAIEGQDGVGKSTQVEELANKLTGIGKKVHIEHFPRYDTPIGSLIGDILKGEVPMPKFEAMQMLYVADQIDFAEKLKLLENQGYDYVILDRYSLSTIVYYCSKVNDNSKSSTVMSWQSHIVKPDLTLVLTSSNTIHDKDDYKELDEFEKDIDFMKNVNRNYIYFANELSRFQSIEVVYAEGSVFEVRKRIENKLIKHKII